MTGTAGDTSGGVAFDTGTAGGGSNDNGGKSSEGAAGTTSTGSAEGAGGVEAAKWYDTVKDPDLRAFAASKNWSDIEASLKSHKELEAAYSAKGSAPKAPADVSEYKFNVDPSLPKGAYNDQFAEQFKGWAKAIDLPVESASKLHDFFVEYAKGSLTAQAQAQADAMNKRISDARSALEAGWGKTDSPDFKRNSEMARRAIAANPGVLQELQAMGVLVNVEGRNMIANAPIMQLLAKMGHGLYAEDGLYGGGGSEKNPFDDKSTDLAMQGRIMKDDPGKAIALIRAAGKEKMFSQFIDKHKGK